MDFVSVGKVLASWGLPQELINNFTENDINIELFPKSTEENLKELCPHLATRILLQDKISELKTTQIQIEGMVGSSILNNMINIFIQNAAQNLLRDELEAFSQLLSQELFDTINEFLANFTLDDLLGL